MIREIKMRAGDAELTFYWCAWEYGDAETAKREWEATQQWIHKKESRSASVWRLADDGGGHPRVVGMSEQRGTAEAMERRLQRRAVSEYAMDDEHMRGLAMRRLGQAAEAVRQGKKVVGGIARFKGRMKLNPDGSLEPLDRPQG